MSKNDGSFLAAVTQSAYFYSEMINYKIGPKKPDLHISPLLCASSCEAELTATLQREQ